MAFRVKLSKLLYHGEGKNSKNILMSSHSQWGPTWKRGHSRIAMGKLDEKQTRDGKRERSDQNRQIFTYLLHDSSLNKTDPNHEIMSGCATPPGNGKEGTSLTTKHLGGGKDREIFEKRGSDQDETWTFLSSPFFKKGTEIKGRNWGAEARNKTPSPGGKPKGTEKISQPHSPLKRKLEAKEGLRYGNHGDPSSIR